MDADSSTKFIGSLTKFLQSLCNGYVEFQRGVELVGHIYLNIDTGEKVDYVLHEKVSKNDENSVTFVSNSFHAQPLDQDKDNKDMSSKSGATTRKGKSISSDDDDIMIVDQSKRVLDSSNSGSFPSRGVKRIGSPISSERHVQRMRSSGSLSSHSRTSSNFHQNNRQHPGPSATVTSQSQRQQGGLSISDVKLEQISKDELASLSSQVGEGSSRPQQGASSTGHSPHSEVWVKQERADDDEGDNEIGWSQGRDDSNSNSGSNLYPVMLHQNPTYPSAAFSGFPGASSSDPGANPYADPMPGSSQDSGGLDPSVEEAKPLVKDEPTVEDTKALELAGDEPQQLNPALKDHPAEEDEPQQLNPALKDHPADEVTPKDDRKKATDGPQLIQTRLTNRHFPALLPATKTNAAPRKNCVVCYARHKATGAPAAEVRNHAKRTRYWCRECNRGLCAVPCFAEFHTKENYNNVEV